jgi:hypothetical protein
MKKIQTIDKATLVAMRTVIESALQGVAKEYGLEITVGNGTYGGSTGSLKVEMVVPTADGIPTVFRQHCGFYGLKPEQFGMVFTHEAAQYKLIGISPGRSYPIIALKLSTNKQVGLSMTDELKAVFTNAVSAAKTAA